MINSIHGNEIFWQWFNPDSERRQANCTKSFAEANDSMREKQSTENKCNENEIGKMSNDTTATTCITQGSEKKNLAE